MVKYAGINHVALVTGDMDKTIRFWRDLLGMRILVAMGRPGYRHYFFEISEYDMIAFFEWPDVDVGVEKDPGAPVRGPVVFDHISIGVASKDDLWDLMERLSNAGFWVSEVVDHGFVLSLYSFDPNNIPLEFSFSTAGNLIRRNPVIVDKNPSPVTLEGPDPNPEVWESGVRQGGQIDRKIYPGDGSDLFLDK
jgi:catechol 2,3-dioxygenase-like lactoylglutathione lyase family enzyme